ncbi:MAG: radical SAM protein [Phycisphaerae bacterium]|nr:radical SAM protein [Phycisphaerae bacterium]
MERECRDLVAAGHREIVLCGVFLGAYGRDTAVRSRWGEQRSQLPNLLRRLAAIDGLWRLRLSSLECLDITDELLAACTETSTVASHFHLPLQSGSNRILRRMNRRYTVEQFLDAVARLRAALDRPAITTDILVGFPGEEEADFAATLAAARHAGFAKIHAFPFSPIPRRPRGCGGTRRPRQRWSNSEWLN